MAPFYMVRYGFKMALMYLVGIGNGLMMAPLHILDIDKFFYFNIADTVHRKGNMYTVKK